MRRKSRPANSHSGRGRDHRADSIRFRRATVADSRALARAVFEALEDYAAFAPSGWTAPSLEEIDEEGHESLADEDVYCVVAEAEGKVVGQITVLPATQALHPDAASKAARCRSPASPVPQKSRVTKKLQMCPSVGSCARARLQRAAAFRARRSSSRATLLRARELASDRQPIRRPNLRVHNGRVPLQAPVD